MRDGGPAFPCKQLDWDRAERGVERYNHFVGMSLRDYFAAAAMREIAPGVELAWLRRDGEPDTQISVFSLTAERAYAYADAMLAERDK